jgi:hypothetical protein
VELTMDDKVLELLTKFYSEFQDYKREMDEKINDLAHKEDNDYRIFEDIVCKLAEMSKLIEKNYSVTTNQQQEILENLSEKIAMLMIRKF